MPHRSNPWSWSRDGVWISLIILLLITGCLVRTFEPGSDEVVQRDRQIPQPAYDLWGQDIGHEQAEQMRQSEAGRAQLSPEQGAVRIDDELLALGRQSFYEETFGNEAFLSGVMGMLAPGGPVEALDFLSAMQELNGEGTTNLRVRIRRDAVIGGRRFREGEYIDTGLDVPKGELHPLGMWIRIDGPRVSAGITCALCHSTVHPETFEIIHGAPNIDFNAGLLMALAPNTAAYFAHTEVDPADYITENSPVIIGSDGKEYRLPEKQAFEDAVDAKLLKWPPGYFDSVRDRIDNPTQNPDSFTWMDHPYNWSGAFIVGPFRGLSVQNNNVHALNSDPFTGADGAGMLLGIDPEYYYAILMQNAARATYQFDFAARRSPSAFFAAIEPTGYGPGLNQMVALPAYPRGSLIDPSGLWASGPGEPIWRRINALSAWQNTLLPPDPPLEVDEETKVLGRRVFQRAGCMECHDGPGLSSHRVIAIDEIQTNPKRARGLADTQKAWSDETLAYAFDQTVPLPDDPRVLRVPDDHVDREYMRLAYAWDNSGGGYKTKGLVGLYWSPPYLHDGGVSVGPNMELGVSETLLKFVRPDPYNSLLAIVDRDLRQRVIEANAKNPDLAQMGIDGTGHEYWIDQSAGFTEDEQRAAILYLLTYQPESRAPPPPPDGGRGGEHDR